MGACDIPVVAQGCDAVDAVENTVGAVQDTVDAVGAVADFASDPMGYMADKAHAGAKGLADNVLPELAKALQPELSTEWFVKAYAVTWALAILAWVAQLIWAWVQTSRRQIAVSEMVDIAVWRSSIFLAGCAFGPLFGMMFVRTFGALTDSLLKTFIGGDSKGISGSTGALLGDSRPTDVAGGDFVLLIVYLAMILGLLVCVITLVVMLVTLYMSGALFPLAWQYLVAPNREVRGRAFSVVKIWVGILLSQPLMFLLLGIAFLMAGGMLSNDLPGGYDIAGMQDAGLQTPSETTVAKTPLQTLMGLLVACVALWMAAVSPAALSKFAPILPTGGGVDGPGLRGKGGGMARGASMAAGAIGGAAASGLAAVASRGDGSADPGGAMSSGAGGGESVLSSVGAGASGGMTRGGTAGGPVGAAAGEASGMGRAAQDQVEDTAAPDGGVSSKEAEISAGSGAEGSGGGSDAAAGGSSEAITGGPSEASEGASVEGDDGRGSSAAGGSLQESAGADSASGAGAGAASGGPSRLGASSGSPDRASGASGGTAGGSPSGRDAETGSSGGAGVAAGVAGAGTALSGFLDEVAEESTNLSERFAGGES